MKYQTIAYSLIFTLSAVLSGCVAKPRPIVPTDGPSTLGPVPADHDDAPRALLVALERVEGALLEGSWQGDTYHATFLMLESREGWAAARYTDDGNAMLSAFIEPQGDSRAQRQLLEAWSKRLGQLYGVEWAPR